MHRRTWPAVFLLVPAVALAVSTSMPRVRPATLEQRENQMSRTLARASQFVDVGHVSSRPSCAEVEPPEALATPDPSSRRRRAAEKSKSVSSSDPMAACTAR